MLEGHTVSVTKQHSKGKAWFISRILSREAWSMHVPPPAPTYFHRSPIWDCFSACSAQFPVLEVMGLVNTIQALIFF